MRESTVPLSGTTTPGRRFTRAAGALFLVAALAATGCSAGGDSGGDKTAGLAAEAPEHQKGGGAAADGKPESGTGGADRSSAKKPGDVVGEHIVRTASLTVVVKDVPDAVAAARAAAEGAGGLVGDETTDRESGGHERSRLVLRVPQAEYEKVLDALAGAGKLVERSASAENVTEQVVDVESRVKSQRASVARIRELLDEATELSDVVTLEGELSTRQADLESLLAQQASLKDRTSLATITLTLSETDAPADSDEDDGPGFLAAVAGGWDAFVTVVHWIAVAVGAALPFVVTLALLALLVRRLRPLFGRGRPAKADSTVTAEAAEANGS
ncbi:DUF4349 domain-containing protein [Streptomyces boluensis]|uniref:DUF4349 domain-containing protein n=1 Tax=Streptomyces boluensis TaxID=1775135 RepID=A0A964URJ0_9ACTN|nr:DUF4349 domain-containing protein [Streptomyces boluensis]NBE51677.1 DUF4349 domain-containing protein [Streptomyces boluensis]